MTTSGPLVLRTPSPGHPVPRRANRIQGPSRPVRGSHLAPHAGKTTAEIHDYHDLRTGVLASSLAKRAPATPASASPTRATAYAHPAPARPERSASLGSNSPRGWQDPRLRRLEAQPLLNHKRQSYGSRT